MSLESSYIIYYGTFPFVNAYNSVGFHEIFTKVGIKRLSR